MSNDINNNSSSILIVDDNVKNLQVLGGYLQNEGLEVEFALEGTSALNWLEKKKFDLILLDIMMPGMDGFEVCSMIKKNPLTREIPVIFITAKTDSESIIKGFESGAVDYINKPFIQSELLIRVKSQLNIKKSKEQIIHYLHQIEERNKNISDSIAYAKYIQNAVLGNSEKNLQHLPEHFILYLPKDILSGDFYWSQVTTDCAIVALMDCTGHGVPGALMSMLGITFLNEIVNIEGIIKPEIILNMLREKIILALGQKGIIQEVHDGMDASIICIDKEKNTLRFSGANHSLFLLRNQQIQVFEGNRMPVTYKENMKDFTAFDVDLFDNDVIYLFSDGYPDQFGGKKGKKLMINFFKQILLDIHLMPMAEQNEILLRHFMQWKGSQEQVDDVTVLGIRI
jgi:phosphoserine phosphatase RsbU/P